MNERPKDASTPKVDDEWEKQLLSGTVEHAPAEAVWTEAWELSLLRYEMVDGPISESLKDIAQAGYPHSRYPLNLDSGIDLDNEMGLDPDHLSSVRALGQALEFSIWVAAMEDRPGDIVDSVHALGTLAKSLYDAPTLYAQIHHAGIHRITVAALEQSFSRTNFSDTQLADIQDCLTLALPPIEEYSMLAQGLVGERVLGSNSLFFEFYVDSLPRFSKNHLWV